MIQISADAVKQLVESKNIAEGYITDLKKLDKKRYKAQIDSSAAIVKTIDSKIALFLGNEDDRQGITRNKEVTVLNRIYEANSYVRSRPNGITKTETILIKQAKDELNNALQTVNSNLKD